MATIFETKPCSRCGGSGSYSWNARHGSRCYGCGGRGWQHTKRGAEAARYLNEILSKPARDFVKGDLIWDAHTRKFYTVVRSERDTGDNFGARMLGFDYEATERWGIESTGTGWSGLDPDKRIRRGATGDEKTEARARALAYEETLTKAGTPRKRTAA
jgi:hypothetical protein